MKEKRLLLEKKFILITTLVIHLLNIIFVWFMNRFLSLFFLVFVLNINAQQLVFDDLLKSTPLPDIKFYDILEDENHDIWLASESGLYKYLGYDYANYSNSKQINQSVFNLQSDKNGRVWCNNLSGQVFYVKNDSLILFYNANRFTNNQFFNFKVYDKYILLTANKGVFKIYFRDKHVDSIIKSKIASSYINKDYTYYYAETSEPCVEILENLKSSKRFLPLPSSKINTTAFYPLDNDRVIFYYKSNQVNNFELINTIENTSISIITPDILQNISINNVNYIDKKLWIATNNGVLVFDIKGQNLKFEKHIFKGLRISKVLNDFLGNYWFTTIGNGVLVIPDLDLKKIDFKNLNISATISLFNDNFVFGTTRGELFFMDKTTIVDSLMLSNKQSIVNLFYSKLDNLLIISTKSGSYQYDLSTKKLKDLKNKFAIAKSIELLGPSTYFYGNFKEGVIYKYDSVITLKHKRVITSNLSGANLYVAYSDGLYEYDTNDWHYNRIFYNGENIFAKQLVYFEDGLYFLTKNNKLLEYKNGQVNKLNQFEDYKLQTINTDGNSFWVKHQNGLLYYEPREAKLSNLYIKDVLSPFKQNVLFLKDYIITLSQNNFYFIPRSNSRLFKKNQIANTKISGLSINNIDTVLADNLILKSHQNNIKITFNTTGYLSKQQTDYSYKLLPIDKDWQHINKGYNFIEFKELPAGDYVFKVRGKNNTSNEYSKVSELSFTIKPQFWQTWWFYVSVLSISILVVLLIVRRKVQIDRKKQELSFNKLLAEKTMASLKLENFRSQMNPHFIFNALNSIQDYIISNEKELASKYLVKFSRLIRIYLEHSQQNMITLNQEITALKLYLELENVRFDGDFFYEIRIADNISLEQIKIPSLFIQPYVENVIKHGLLHKTGDKRLKIRLTVESSLLKISIEDNGIGRQKSKEIRKASYKSFSTNANKERIKLYREKLKLNINVIIEDLKDADNNALGTRVIIFIPIQN